MKTPLHTLLAVGLMALGLSAAAQTPVPVSNSFSQSPDGEFSVFNSITKYLVRGDAASLSSWFANTLDVTVISSTRNCSRRQAQEILRTFFESYTPRSFTVTHKASEANKKYLIGLLSAGGEVFQVTIYATSIGGETYKIQELSITRQAY
ncbi:MAG: DUF4783 domain-containing protein [Bacteroidales bacterium]|nr:DUF4783 domain-containing protein [Bacteroidales bacterium]